MKNLILRKQNPPGYSGMFRKNKAIIFQCMCQLPLKYLDATFEGLLDSYLKDLRKLYQGILKVIDTYIVVQNFLY